MEPHLEGTVGWSTNQGLGRKATVEARAVLRFTGCWTEIQPGPADPWATEKWVSLGAGTPEATW